MTQKGFTSDVREVSENGIQRIEGEKVRRWEGEKRRA